MFFFSFRFTVGYSEIFLADISYYQEIHVLKHGWSIIHHIHYGIIYNQLTEGRMKALSLFQMYGLCTAEIKQWPLMKCQGVTHIYSVSMAIMWHPSTLDPKHQNQRT